MYFAPDVNFSDGHRSSSNHPGISLGELRDPIGGRVWGWEGNIFFILTLVVGVQKIAMEPLAFLEEFHHVAFATDHLLVRLGSVPAGHLVDVLGAAYEAVEPHVSFTGGLKASEVGVASWRPGELLGLIRGFFWGGRFILQALLGHFGAG